MLFAIHTDPTEFLDSRQRTEVILVKSLVTTVVSILQLEGIEVLLLHRRNGSSHRAISLMPDVGLRGLDIQLRMMLPRLDIQTARWSSRGQRSTNVDSDTSDLCKRNLNPPPVCSSFHSQRRSTRKHAAANGNNRTHHEHTIAVSVGR
jgi:hypothetical protein